MFCLPSGRMRLVEFFDVADGQWSEVARSLFVAAFEACWLERDAPRCGFLLVETSCGNPLLVWFVLGYPI